jgi:predicted GNAT superfamily acetyltransferase
MDETRMSEPNVDIRPPKSIAEFQSCIDIQRAAWSIEDDRYLIPIATLIAAHLHGGVVLGAFLPSSQTVGFSFAFLGSDQGEIILYSQLTGVHPDFQSLGIGAKLKHAQRAEARRSAIEATLWAFDPLQAGNAKFNLSRLGAMGIRYIADMYGPRTDRLNNATPTDRLIARWETNKPPTHHLSSIDIQHTVDIIVDVDTKPTHHSDRDLPDVDCLTIPIPRDITKLRTEIPALASDWQAAVRYAFTRSLAAGYIAIGYTAVESSVVAGRYQLARRTR